MPPGFEWIGNLPLPQLSAGASDPALVSAEPIPRRLVVRLNEIDDEFDIVDAIRREEAGDA